MGHTFHLGEIHEKTYLARHHATFLVGNATAQGLVGTYKLISFTSKFDDGTSYEFLGPQPVGYAVITPKVFTSILVSTDRKPGNTADAKLALFNSLIAYSGPYTIEGSKLITLKKLPQQS